MKKYIYLCMIMLAGCKIKQDSNQLSFEYADFEKYKIQTIASYNTHISSNQEKYYLESIDSTYYDPFNRSITRTMHYPTPGCFQYDSKEVNYLDSSYLCYLKVYIDKKDEIDGIEFLDGRENKFIDSCLKKPPITYTRITHLIDKKITVTRGKNTLDSTMIFLKKGRPQTKIQCTGSSKHNNFQFDTTYYRYPKPGLQVISQGKSIDSIYTFGNKKREIRYHTDYGRQFSYITTYASGSIVKTVYIGRHIKDVNLYKYRANQLTEEKQIRNDTLLRKVVYEYSNRLLQHIYTYNFRCTTTIKQLEVIGYDKFGTDSLPRFTGHFRDSIYYDYHSKPNITTYKYTFY